MSRTLNVRRDGAWLPRGRWSGILADGIPQPMENVIASVPAGTTGTIRVSDTLPTFGATITGIERTRDDPTGQLGGPFTIVDETGLSFPASGSPFATPPGEQSFRDFTYLVAGDYTFTERAVNNTTDPVSYGSPVSVQQTLGAPVEGGGGGVVTNPAGPALFTDATGVQAGPSDRVSAMTGVNVHLNYSSYKNDAPGGQNAIIDKVADIGFRHIRDDTSSGSMPAIIRAGNLYGVKYWPLFHNNNTSNVTSQVQGVLNSVASVRPYVDGMLGYNEPDNGSYHTSSSIRAQQQQMYNVYRGDSRFNDLPITTWASTFPKNSKNTGAGNVDAWADGADWHPYPAGTRPETNKGHDFFGEKAAMDDRLGSTPHLFTPGEWDRKDAWKNGGHFHVLSEMGWHNNITDKSEGHRGASRSAAALYAPPSLLWYDSKGIARVMFYEMLNQATKGSEQSGSIQGAFGIVEQNLADKPIAVSIRRFLALYTDKGVAFTPGKLNYTLTGGNSKTYHMLHQRRNGTFLLGVYQAEEVWDDGSYTPRTPPADLTLTLRMLSRNATVRIYRPDVSGAPSSPVAVPQGTNFQVTSGPGLRVLEITA